jgi:hypothetical protein
MYIDDKAHIRRFIACRSLLDAVSVDWSLSYSGILRDNHLALHHLMTTRPVGLAILSEIEQACRGGKARTSL